MLALSSRTRLGTVERALAIAAATLPAEAQRRLTVMPIEITTGYRRPDGPTYSRTLRNGLGRSTEGWLPIPALKAKLSSLRASH